MAPPVAVTVVYRTDTRFHSESPPDTIGLSVLIQSMPASEILRRLNDRLRRREPDSLQILCKTRFGCMSGIGYLHQYAFLGNNTRFALDFSVFRLCA